MKARLNPPIIMPSFNEVYGYLEMGNGNSYQFRDVYKVQQSINLINKILRKKYDGLVYLKTEEETTDWSGERVLYSSSQIVKNSYYGNCLTSQNSPLAQVKWNIVMCLESSILGMEYYDYYKIVVDLFRIIGVEVERVNSYGSSGFATASTVNMVSRIMSNVSERDPSNTKTVPTYNTHKTDLFFTMYVVLKKPLISSFTTNSDNFALFEYELQKTKDDRGFLQRVTDWLYQ